MRKTLRLSAITPARSGFRHKRADQGLLDWTGPDVGASFSKAQPQRAGSCCWGTLGGGRPFKLLQDRGQTFRDGLLDGIQLGPERSPNCQQPRRSPSALIKPRRSTTFPLLLALSMKLRGINGHEDLGFTIIFEDGRLFDSSPNASAQYISASFRYRRPSRSDLVTTVRRAYSFALIFCLRLQGIGSRACYSQINVQLRAAVPWPSVNFQDRYARNLQIRLPATQKPPA